VIRTSQRPRKNPRPLVQPCCSCIFPGSTEARNPEALTPITTDQLKYRPGDTSTGNLPALCRAQASLRDGLRRRWPDDRSLSLRFNCRPKKLPPCSHGPPNDARESLYPTCITDGKSEMAGGWTRDGAVQDQIDDSVTDAVMVARARLPTGDGLSHCEDCGDAIPAGRRQALPGVRTCVACQSERDGRPVISAVNRRANKDSQLR
jgi:phage/conjugal plasmid C-4 type zinc finger TraR family protein